MKGIILKISLLSLLWGIQTHGQSQPPMPWQPKNGDLILFEDLDILHQGMYRTFEGNPISHVGIVIISPSNGVPYIMHALGKHATLTRSVSPNKKEGVVFDELIPYLKESMESTTDKNKIYVRRKLESFTKEDEKRFYEWVTRMAGRPYDSVAADRLLLKPIIPLPFYKEKPAIIEPKSTFCSGLVGAFCISGHLISPPMNRPDLKKMTRAEYSAWVNQQAITPADFWGDQRLNLSQTFERPAQIIIPKKIAPKK